MGSSTLARLPAVPLAIAAVYVGIHAGDAARVQRANEYGLQGRLDAAVAEAVGVRGAPEEARALYTIAVARAAQGSPEAVGAWERALRLDPNNWQAALGYARALAAAGRGADARRALTRVRTLNPRARLPAL